MLRICFLFFKSRCLYWVLFFVNLFFFLIRFEMAYTHTLYYLAQVYKNMGQYERAGQYCHSTLQRQLKFSQFVPLEWAINAATLSQYYITKVSIKKICNAFILSINHIFYIASVRLSVYKFSFAHFISTKFRILALFL